MEVRPLQDKVAIITGAGSPIGIGHAMALALADAGARVAMLDINKGWLEQSANEVRRIGGDKMVLPIVADVSSPEDCQKAVSETISEFGGLHILLNNAGANPRTAGLGSGNGTNFWDVSPEAWFRVVSVNFIGPFLMARAVVAHMLQQKWGRIIGVTTSLDTMYRKGLSPYGPSKAGHEAFVATIAQELEGTGVTANVLVPGGPANTNLLVTDPQRAASLIQPEVMKVPAVWLSSEASNGVNGQRIIAKRWNENLPIAERLEKASAPAAWTQLGKQSVDPGD